MAEGMILAGVAGFFVGAALVLNIVNVVMRLAARNQTKVSNCRFGDYCLDVNCPGYAGDRQPSIRFKPGDKVRVIAFGHEKADDLYTVEAVTATHIRAKNDSDTTTVCYLREKFIKSRDPLPAPARKAFL